MSLVSHWSPNLSQPWSHCPHPAPCLSCAFGAVIPWCHSMRICKTMRWTFRASTRPGFLLQMCDHKSCPGVWCEDNEESLPFIPGAAVRHILTKKKGHRWSAESLLRLRLYGGPKTWLISSETWVPEFSFSPANIHQLPCSNYNELPPLLVW